RGKARDFNWHNTIGFWSAIPLAIIVAGGAVISYPWATALVYRAYGEAPPAPAGAVAARGGPTAMHVERLPLDLMVTAATERMGDWKTISIALPPPSASRVVLTLDSGDGGQPQKRATLTLDSQTAAIVRWEPFGSLTPGRRARTWLRFAHTGEVYGLAGQTVAGLITAGAAVLVWTGLALALRRYLRWRKRSSDAMLKAA
ncbi:MAG: PepSY-associated TM helix domain-containing protein, partial [Vicinamibacterales bacterium]